MNFRVGTSGYSYKEWKGHFYPEKIAADEMLRFYGTQLPSVEINNSFYRLPKASVLENWADQVPNEFRFAIKASRRITHMKRLKAADDETGYLLKTVATLGDKLGVILYQLPPNLKKDLERLDAFLELLDGQTKSVFEFRNESWFDEEVYERLRKSNCALCLSDVDEEDEPSICSTANFGYLRLRRMDYDDDALARWIENIQAQGWDEAYVYFKHEDEGAGPKTAMRFLEAAK